MVLLELDSPRDVYSFICTSKFIYRVFRLHQVTILRAALTNAVPPQIMPDFLRAHHAHQCNSLSARREFNAKSQSSIGSIYERNSIYVQLRIKRVLGHLTSGAELRVDEDLRSQGVLVSLCKLWFIVDYFIDDFAKNALAVLRNNLLLDHSKGLQDACTLPLSKPERHRLFRAFCRFEEYRRLFAGPDHVSSVIVTPPRHAQEEFIARYFLWEHLELLSIWRYLVGKMTKVMVEQDDEVVATLLKTVRKEGDNPEKHVSVDVLDLLGLEKFDTIDHKLSHIEFMVELGLPFLKRLLLTMDSEQRRDVISLFCNTTAKPSLGDLVVSCECPPRRRDATLDAETEDILKENPSFHLFSISVTFSVPFNPRRLYLVHPCQEDEPNERMDGLFEESGLIFWGKERLDLISPKLSSSDFVPDKGVEDISLFKVPEPVESKVLSEVQRQLRQTTFPILQVDGLNQFLDGLEY